MHRYQTCTRFIFSLRSREERTSIRIGYIRSGHPYISRSTTCMSPRVATFNYTLLCRLTFPSISSNYTDCVCYVRASDVQCVWMWRESACVNAGKTEMNETSDSDWGEWGGNLACVKDSNGMVSRTIAMDGLLKNFYNRASLLPSQDFARIN